MTTPAPTPTDDAPIAPRLLSIADACAYASIGRTKLLEEVAAGKIATRKFGARTLIERASMDQYLDSLPAATLAPPRRRRTRGAA